MDDYIKRDDALQAIESCAGWSRPLGSAYEEIQEMPAADVAPVVHGKWIINEYEYFTCSECGNGYYNGAQSTAQAKSFLKCGFADNYCGYCGAKMDKEDNT